MSAFKQFFIGLDTLEELLSTHDPEQPLYFTVRRQCRSTSTVGYVSCVTYQLISDVQGGVARYWYYMLGQHEELGSQPMSQERLDKIVHRAQTAEEQIPEFLRTESGCQVLRGGVSFPEELQLLDGSTRLFTYDHNSGRYRFKGRTATATEPAPAPSPLDLSENTLYSL